MLTMTAHLSIRIEYEILDVKRGGRSVRWGSVDSIIDYQRLIHAYGNRTDMDIYLMLIDDSDGRIIDGIICHNPSDLEVDGYSFASHENRYRKLLRTASKEEPLRLAAFLEMKLNGNLTAERVAITSSDIYYKMLDRRRMHRGSWEEFTLIIIDISDGERTIDKLDMKI